MPWRAPSASSASAGRNLLRPCEEESRAEKRFSGPRRLSRQGRMQYQGTGVEGIQNLPNGRKHAKKSQQTGTIKKSVHTKLCTEYPREIKTGCQLMER
jgi:hypothetical protein